MLRELGARGAGAADRAVLAERGPGYVPPASAPSDGAVQILERRTVSRPCGDRSTCGYRSIGRVHFRDPGLPFILETERAVPHEPASTSSSWSADRRAGHGWLVVREVTDIDVLDTAEASGRRRAGGRATVSLRAARRLGRNRLFCGFLPPVRRLGTGRDGDPPGGPGRPSAMPRPIDAGDAAAAAGTTPGNLMDRLEPRRTATGRS